MVLNHAQFWFSPYRHLKYDLRSDTEYRHNLFTLNIYSQIICLSNNALHSDIEVLALCVFYATFKYKQIIMRYTHNL